MTKEEKYIKAKNKIKQIKNFRWFVLAAVMASIYMIGFSVFLYTNENQYSLTPIAIFIATTFGVWVIAFFEYIKIFNQKVFFLKDWEEKQIQKYMKKEEVRIDSKRYQ